MPSKQSKVSHYNTDHQWGYNVYAFKTYTCSSYNFTSQFINDGTCLILSFETNSLICIYLFLMYTGNSYMSKPDRYLIYKNDKTCLHVLKKQCCSAFSEMSLSQTNCDRMNHLNCRMKLAVNFEFFLLITDVIKMICWILVVTLTRKSAHCIDYIVFGALDQPVLSLKGLIVYDITKPPWESEHGWVITSHIQLLDKIIYPGPKYKVHAGTKICPRPMTVTHWQETCMIFWKQDMTQAR